MDIHNFLSVSRTKSHVDGISKKRVLETLAKVFADDISAFNVDELYQNLISREKLGTTGIGGGIAIPHCRFNTEGATYCACLTLETPIDFDAVDNKPVDIIFAMLVPENAESSHLEMLAKLAEMLQQPALVKRLRDATSDAELYDIAVSQ